MDPLTLGKAIEPALKSFETVTKIVAAVRRKLVADPNKTLDRFIEILASVEASYDDILKAMESLLNVDLRNDRVARSALESATLGEGYASEVSNARLHCAQIKAVIQDNLTRKVIGDETVDALAAEFDLNDGEFIRSVEQVADHMRSMARELLDFVERKDTDGAERYLEDARSALFQVRSEAAAGKARMHLLLEDLQTAVQTSPLRQAGS